ncbi:MAG TPA: hypothetical protein VGN72_09620 [Tepidisphaeraceae bacterium]|jgi:hypothetical protein|nr:hypothetical protein [Tepidisphaeraceae bacterium]
MSTSDQFFEGEHVVVSGVGTSFNAAAQEDVITVERELAAVYWSADQSSLHLPVAIGKAVDGRYLARISTEPRVLNAESLAALLEGLTARGLLGHSGDVAKQLTMQVAIAAGVTPTRTLPQGGPLEICATAKTESIRSAVAELVTLRYEPQTDVPLSISEADRLARRRADRPLLAGLTAPGYTLALFGEVPQDLERELRWGTANMVWVALHRTSTELYKSGLVVDGVAVAHAPMRGAARCGWAMVVRDTRSGEGERRHWRDERHLARVAGEAFLRCGERSGSKATPTGPSEDWWATADDEFANLRPAYVHEGMILSAINEKGAREPVLLGVVRMPMAHRKAIAYKRGYLGETADGRIVPHVQSDVPSQPDPKTGGFQTEVRDTIDEATEKLKMLAADWGDGMMLHLIHEAPKLARAIETDTYVGPEVIA